MYTPTSPPSTYLHSTRASIDPDMYYDSACSHTIPANCSAEKLQTFRIADDTTISHQLKVLRTIFLPIFVHIRVCFYTSDNYGTFFEHIHDHDITADLHVGQL